MEQVTLGQALVTQVVLESNHIIISQSNGLIYIINSIDKETRIIQNDTGVWALAASKSYIASGDIAGRLRIWDITTGYDFTII
jgi:WD40 repeat protein